MNEIGVLELFKKLGVIHWGHFVGTRGKHLNAYFSKDGVYARPKVTSLLCYEIAEQFRYNSVETVIGPVIGGVNLANRVAEHLSVLNNMEVFAVFAEKEIIAIPDPEGLNRKCFAETGEFTIGRGYGEFITGKKVLVVEDALTTGGTAKKVIEVVRAIGGEVVGLGVIWNRGGVKWQDMRIPKLVSLVTAMLGMWDEANCPLCKRNIPVDTDFGKGSQFLARKK
jgi:orotate phosphoribosyltransferase